MIEEKALLLAGLFRGPNRKEELETFLTHSRDDIHAYCPGAGFLEPTEDEWNLITAKALEMV